ncbi:MAG: cold shock domain-containing protein [Anaerolineae bacterium]|nr:cold shock domain-containing protein [Anaerolineae bacterium]
MNFTDRWATDADGNRFVFTVELQRRLHEAGLPVEPESLDQLGEAPAPTPVRDHQPETARHEEPAQDDLMPETMQIDPETGKYIGRLKWYNPARGYGFIARGAGEDIFFHKTGALIDPTALDEGQWVLYDVEQRKKGPEATEVETYEGELAS